MEKKDVINIILGISEDSNLKSTLQIALKQARRLIGYDMSKNEVTHGDLLFRNCDYNLDLTVEQKGELYRQNSVFEEQDLFTAVILYLIILDQLGHIFGNRGSKLSNKVKEAIELTSYKKILNSKQKNAISQLRNSLCHNFGLCSFVPKTNDIKYKYIFLFNEHVADKVISKIVKDTDSDIKMVEVNVLSLCNMVENIVSEYVDNYKSGAIDSIIDKDGLKARFLIYLDK